MESDDPDTKAFRVSIRAERAGRQSGFDAEGTRGELSSGQRSQRKRWQIERTYEFATPETALMFVACLVAVSMARGVWPEVELCRERVAVRLACEQGPTAEQRAAWRELVGWAQKLGARGVATGGVTRTLSST